MLRVLVCGGRHYTNRLAIYRELHALVESTGISLVIEGEAPGADTLGREEAFRLKIPVMAFPANWDWLHRAAGPIRNGWMLEFGRPDLVLAFHDNISQSKGTKDMVLRAQRVGVEVRVIAE